MKLGGEWSWVREEKRVCMCVFSLFFSFFFFLPSSIIIVNKLNQVDCFSPKDKWELMSPSDPPMCYDDIYFTCSLFMLQETHIFAICFPSAVNPISFSSLVATPWAFQKPWRQEQQLQCCVCPQEPQSFSSGSPGSSITRKTRMRLDFFQVFLRFSVHGLQEFYEFHLEQMK